MTHKALCDFFVASCVDDGGAYRLRLHGDGGIEQVQKIPMSCPMFLQTENGLLWATLRHPFENSSESGVANYDIHSGHRHSEIVSTMGEVACHIAVSEKAAYCANYVSGSVFATPTRLSVHKGKGVDQSRQKSPHPHSVIFSPDRRFVLTCDLGMDTVFVYDRDLKEISRTRVPDGSGARHAVFSKDGKYLYCINEMGGSISVMSWSAPNLTLLSTVSILPSQYSGVGSGAAIKLSRDGAYLYATERATGSIVTLRADGAYIDVVAETGCHGKEPRDFTLLADDCFAVCTNQFSDNVAVFQINDRGIPQYLNSVEIKAPLCAIELA